MKTIFCQVSNQLINPPTGDISEKYYNNLYDKHERDGYYKGKDFWEIPLWIAEASGFIRGEKELHIVRNVEDSVIHLNRSGADRILFSVLDVNKAIVKTIIKKVNKPFILGGYALDDSLNRDNVVMLETMQQLADLYITPYEYKLDFSLFKGCKTIPRLTMSTGCRYRCKFCTVPNEVIAKSIPEIFKQVYAFEPLDFKLVYLNDKTFGQEANHEFLHELYHAIKQYNPKFEGFIIQTTCQQVLKGFNKPLSELFVKVVELGVETYNNDLLRALNKPQNTNTIDKAMDLLVNLDIKIIPNFIIGIKGETRQTYHNTLAFVDKHFLNIYAMNIYNLALYDDSDLDIIGEESDKNENSVEKSFHTDEERENAYWFSGLLFSMGLCMITTPEKIELA